MPLSKLVVERLSVLYSLILHAIRRVAALVKVLKGYCCLSDRACAPDGIARGLLGIVEFFDNEVQLYLEVEVVVFCEQPVSTRTEPLSNTQTARYIARTEAMLLLEVAEYTGGLFRGEALTDEELPRYLFTRFFNRFNCSRWDLNRLGLLERFYSFDAEALYSSTA
jgi:hypothetical protein